MEPRNPDNSSKRQENTPGLIDRISALPDSILGLILSCLSTKDAVATAILSKRWKLVWMTVHNLDFCLELPEDDTENELLEEEAMKFVQFVNRVLLLHDAGWLNKFHLVWKPRCNPDQVTSWINSAISSNIHHLVISIWSFYRNFEALEVPVSLFSCVSLQSLELDGTISISAATVICLPRLEILKLDSVYFKSEEAFEKLISGCPMLNYMRMYLDTDATVTYSEDIVMFTYKISSTSLRRLEIRVKYSEDYWYIPRMELKTSSSLEYFKLFGYIHEVSVQGTLSSLVESDFQSLFCEDEFREDNHKSIVEAVHAFNCAKSLTLSPEVMWALSNATVRLPKFTRLRKLEAQSSSCYCRSLQDFIQSANSLEVLIIYQDNSHLEEYHDLSKWIAPVEIPRCLSNSLKELSIIGYSGYGDEHEMIGYVLKHGSVLNAMEVITYACIRKELNFELFKEMIHRFPRKSPLLNVKLWGKHCPERLCSICDSVGPSDMENVSFS